MALNFERWMGYECKSRGNACYVRFGKNQMYVSTMLLKKSKTESGKFDILIDPANRAFAMKFSDTGNFRVTSTPGQVSACAFIHSMNPKMGKRIVMGFDEKSGLWIGHLDGGAVDISQVSMPRESENGQG